MMRNANRSETCSYGSDLSRILQYSEYGVLVRPSTRHGDSSFAQPLLEIDGDRVNNFLAVCLPRTQPER